MTLEKLYSSVSIITTLADGIPYGMTAAWVMQISFRPPMVAVAIGKSSTTLKMILKTGKFGINICGERCLETAIRFGTTSGPNKFEGINWEKRHDIPFIPDAIAFIVADVAERVDVGDHVLITARVVHEEILSTEEKPILYGEDSILTIGDLTKLEF